MATSVINDRQFGILIAFIIPGFILVDGVSYHWSTAANWIAHRDQPTVGGFLYITLASIAAGLIASTIRWIVVDPLLHLSGVERPQWKIAELHRRVDAFEMIVLYTYRYYQFYANSLVALPIWFVLQSMSNPVLSTLHCTIFVLLELTLLIGARDTLKKYYDRTNDILQDSDRAIIIPSR